MKFIHRPILSIVLSLIIGLLGLLTLTQLPMTQFPSIAPPEVNVTVEYTGANAETVTKAALVPLERAINGVPGMKYMSSDAGNDGVGVVQIIFEVGTNPDVAAVNVQNRVAAVMAELPAEVIRNGVKIAKEENAMLMYLNIYSKDTTVEEKFLYNFADINILAELKRIKGVGYADILGAKEYAMRIWLRPDKMLAYNISTEDVLRALENSNVEAAPGKVGESTDKKSQSLQYVIKYTGKFNDEQQYRNIPLRASTGGQILRIKDVADVEFGTAYFDVEAKLNGKPCAAIMMKQLPGSNASEVIDNVKKRMAEIKQTFFLQGMDYEISYDVSRFLDASVHEVLKTLIEAFILVSLVVYIFLQDWRSTLIPAIAVPVSLVGTFFFMQFLGFSLNLITLFALVLAIGIVVDNAIVVVEAVHAKMEHSGISPMKATEKAMREISGAIIAITLVMSAVFIPVAFMPGPSGIFYRQFSLTMAIAIVLSGVVALTLTPALCGMLLKNNHQKKSKFFRAFNKWYGNIENRYQKLLSKIANRKAITFLVLLFFCVGTGFLNKLLSSGFIPNEDQGTFYASVTTPSGSTLERTKAVVNEIQRSCNGIDAIESVSTLAGTNILSDGTGATYGTALINLKSWDERKQSVDEVMRMLEEKTKHIKDAKIEFFPPPAVPGYGNASGFELRLLDKTGSGDLKKMEVIVNRFIDDLKARPEIASAFTIFDASFPQYLLHVDEDMAAQKGVTISEALGSLQTLLGSEYATNFIKYGQMYKVMVQALPEYRSKPDDILKLYVKNGNGEMVPLSAFMRIEKIFGVDQVTRYNMFPSAELNGEASPGYSSGSAIKAIQETAAEKLPKGYGIDWAGITRDEVAQGNEAIYIFMICLVFVYLLLAAQYESFLLPLPVILSLPTGVFGAFFLLWTMGLENNIYAQIAMIMLIGLLGKNAILIVEFAMLKQREGATPLQAAIEGAKTRLRPILMTSFAFIAGLIPLMFASGAGAVGNSTIGTASAGGMLFGTVFGVIIIPGLYVIFATLAQKPVRKSKKAQVALTAIVTMVLFSCKLPQPVHQISVEKIPSTFNDNVDTANAATIDWRYFFTDKNLIELIDTALKNNYDLQMALQRIRASQPDILFAKGALRPVADIGVVTSLRKFGNYTMDGAGNITTEIQTGKIVPTHLPDYFAGLQTSWEVDLWGKLKNQKKAAIARFLSTVEGKNLVTSSIVAEVASAYYELLGLEQRLKIIEETISIQENAWEMVKVQKEAAVVNELAVKQFEAQWLNVKTLRAEVLQSIAEVENRINVLTARFPQPVKTDSLLFQQALPSQISTGLPAALLQNRPDIRQAEFELQAARADLFSARAAFYPSFNITGGLGLQAFKTNLLLTTPESVAYTLFGSLTAPLINKAAIKANFNRANAVQLEALYNYHKIILNGFSEVYIQLTRIKNIQEVFELRTQEADALTQSIEIAEELFKSGRATYLEVLFTQQNALQARLNLVEAKKNQFLSTVNIYKALGGGWR